MPKRKCDEVNLTIGQRLKRYRNACDLTQQQVADTLNINRTTYTKYETGVSEPSHDLLRKMVDMFGTDFNAILSADDTFERDVFDSRLPMYNLTRKEQDIIAMYRVLDEEKRDKLVELLKTLRDEKPENKD